MEFHEKLQQLRKQNQMTQEELGEQLFVSRTTVSKWESGRGYPNLDSLKAISKLFSVSIDDLLSNDELIVLAETENRNTVSRISMQVFGVMDLMALVFLFLPLFGEQEGEYVRAVTIWTNSELSAFMRILYVASLGAVSGFGIFEILHKRMDREKNFSRSQVCSIILHAAAIILFAISRQPYVTVLLFLFFAVKVLLIIQMNHIR